MRFRHIAGGLAVLIVAACSVPAAASATTVTAPRPLPETTQWLQAPATGSAAASTVPGSPTGRNRGKTLRARSARSV